MRNGDAVLAAAVVLVVGMMLIPLPPVLLDLLFAVNISISLMMLLVTMYTMQPLDFAVFPSLLLLTTILRLALNVSATRLILLGGYAGQIINSFGNFVVGGDPVVGFIVFLILVIIQFIVITRGAERVAEVAARFTLDALPGKQMSIDADLNAGLINDQQARERRQKVQREADFYGSMDGASKFVKGDAIAALLITAINLIGGFIIGVFSGMSPLDSWQTYALLTVGGGLAAQVPALLISTATGIIVTRAASDGSLGEDLVGQLLAQPKILGISGGVLMALGVVPGLPHIPFLALGVGLLGLASVVRSGARKKKEAAAREARDEEAEALRRPESVLPLIPLDPLEIELGYGLIGLADPSQGGDLLDRVVMVRRQMALDWGLVVPPIRVRDNLGQLEPNEYVIKLRGAEVAKGELMADHYLAMSPCGEDDVQGIPTKEPAFGLPAVWVTGEAKEKTELLGYTVVDPSSVLATHLAEVLKSRAYELLTRQTVKDLLDTVKQSHAALVDELSPNLLSLGEIQKVLQNLLREGIPVRDMVTILETLADYARVTRETDLLTEYVRQAMARTITRQFKLNSGRAKVVTVDPALERRVLEAVKKSDRGSYIALDPALIESIGRSLDEMVGRLISTGAQPVVLCSSPVRVYVRRLVERLSPRVAVLAYEEIDPSAQLESVGMISA
ncbi:MAG: flagellar biosynthesis protein FlhA [Firmicutes bacterium]|nr:flagellar biosynthesis protein FlhA [Bacillota bacterium]